MLLEKNHNCPVLRETDEKQRILQENQIEIDFKARIK